MLFGLFGLFRYIFGISTTRDRIYYAMNAIFTWLISLSAIFLLFADPDLFLSSALKGASKGATLCIALLSSYALWLGLIAVWEKSGLANKISFLLKPFAKKLFKTKDDEALTAICMNLSLNMLGIGGAATPYGVQAAKLLDKTKNAEYSSALLFVVNATSVQLFPTAIVGVRTSLGSLSPSDIILPSFLATVFSTLLGVLLTKGYFALKEKRVYGKVLGRTTKAGTK